MGSLDDRVALVTGASRGIGLAIAVELARAGAKVALNHHPNTDPSEVDAAADAVASAGGVYLHVYADVSDREQVQAMVDRIVAEWGRIDILVNNAGIVRDRTLRKMTPEEWQEVINVDLGSVYNCTSAVVPLMSDQEYGRIVSISSVVAQTGNFGQTNYAAAKAGILGFTKAAALELARYNVTVNAICPGFVETGMLATVPEANRERIRLRIPLGRFAKPEEIARAVLFLVSDADYVTGQQLNVNGGLYM